MNLLDFRKELDRLIEHENLEYKNTDIVVFDSEGNELKVEHLTTIFTSSHDGLTRIEPREFHYFRDEEYMTSNPALAVLVEPNK